MTAAALLLVTAGPGTLWGQGVGSKPVLTPAPISVPPSVPAPTAPSAVPGALPASSAGQTTPGATPSPAVSGALLPTSAGQPSNDAAPISANYQIGPADSLTVNVWQNPNFSGAFEVRPDGKIAMPLLGDLDASGITPMALADSIAQKLKKYVIDPLVTVNITSVNSKRIYLIGEVGHVGPMMLTAGLSPMQAISTAGGLGTFANAKKIYILRTVDGKEQKIPFNYKKAIKNGDQQGIVLKPGDTIVVP